MPTPDASQLRTILAEKFPGLRMRLDEPRAVRSRFQPTGVTQIDGALGGGLPGGALTEIVVPRPSGGGSTLIRAILEQTAKGSGLMALIDGTDSFDVTSIEESILTRLLWVRCQTAANAVKAADLVLRDGNLPVVLLDLKLNPESQLRKIPASTWYRFQRLLETTGAACAVLTPRPCVSRPQARISPGWQFTLPALESPRAELLQDLK